MCLGIGTVVEYPRKIVSDFAFYLGASLAFYTIFKLLIRQAQYLKVR